jgi:beta-1,4-mannosyltransferase
VTARAAPASRPIRVLFAPTFQANPYQSLLADALAPLGVEVTFARSPRRDPLPLLRQWQIHGRPGIVHLHWTHPYLGGDREPGRIMAGRFIGQLRLLRRMGVRLVWTVHNLAGHDGPRATREMEVHRWIVDSSRAVICHCEAAADAVTEAYGLSPSTRGKLHVIPHGSYIGGYPDSIGRDDARARLGQPKDARVFLFTGSLRGYKGLDDLVAAFRSVEDADARLLIAGAAGRDSSIVSELRAAAADDPRITIHPSFVEPDQLQVFLNSADAVVLPFRDILTSGSAIMAMGFGKPVIAPRLGCLPETIPAAAGILYDPAAPGSLAQALRDALRADLTAMGARARERAAQLDWSRIAVATSELYREATHAA